MADIRQTASMLDHVRRTSGHGRAVRTDLDDILNCLPRVAEVEFEGPMNEPEPEDTFKGDEFRYFNVPPTRLAHMVELDNNEDDQQAMELALRFWRGQGDSGIVAGEPYRGEPRQEVRAASMRELAANVNPVAYTMVGGSLRAGGIPSMGEPAKPGEYDDRGVIDWGLLTSMGPAPEPQSDNDWF